MSDFLVQIGHGCEAARLLALLKQPYGAHAPRGQGFDFAWGSLAVLEDRLASNANIVPVDGGVLAWVGDLVGDVSERFMHDLAARLAHLKNCRAQERPSLEYDELLNQINGTFGLILVDQSGFSIVTDPMGFTQVFVGRNRAGRATVFGTHADIVAVLGNTCASVDVISLAEFLRKGYCTFGSTMHANVTELKPGSVHFMQCLEGQGARSGCLSYWCPPEEIGTAYDVDELAEGLREKLLVAIRSRCNSGTVGVALSGGLDSRMVMAGVPEAVECVGLTMCDARNREARVAQRVAAAYQRPWFALLRQHDYIAENFVSLVRFVGCECDVLHAHLFGFADVVCDKVDTLFTGDLSDTLLRAYCAKDYDYRHRLGGLLPRRYERTAFDYLYWPPDLWDEGLTDEVLAGMGARLTQFYRDNAAQQRGSIAEWLKVYPFRHWLEVATWAAQRRRLPIRLVFADRTLLDFAFTCPVEAKLGDRVFLKAGRGILGRGVHIPCANDGVRPGSGHWSRLAQRAVRKSHDWGVRVLERLGKSPVIQHSWHDYEKYWRQSAGIRELRGKYGANLDRLDGVLFKEKGRALLEDEQTPWEAGFRLLQVAIWLGVMEEYKAAVGHCSADGHKVETHVD